MNRLAVYLGVKLAILHLDKHGYKTLEYFMRTLDRLIQDVYDGHMGGDFQNIMADLVYGQLTRAWEEGMIANGLTKADMAPEWQTQLDDIIQSEWSYVDQLYKDVVDARVDKTPIDALLARADLWGNRYNDVVNQATLATADAKDRLVWRLGNTEEHCDTCAALNGIVASATEWEQSGFKPQNPPNDLLTCGGWRCDCSLEPTDQRRSPNALDTLMNIATRSNM